VNSADATVVVIGGGFAGLGAATRLAEAGRRVLLLEARPRLGGRATAFTDPVTRERVDNGQHVLFGCYEETLRLLRRIGAEDGVLRQSNLTFHTVDLDGRVTRFRCPALPSPFHLLAGVLSWDALAWSDRLAVLGMRSALRPLPDSADRPHVRESVRQWLRKHGQTDRLIALLWEPLAVAALNQSIDEAQAHVFARVLTTMLGSGRDGTSMVLPVRPLDELYAVPSRSYLEQRGGAVRCGVRARVRGGAGGVVVEVGDEVLAPSAVIVAVAWHELPGVLESSEPGLLDIVGRARDTPSSPIVTVNLWLDRDLPVGPIVGLPGRTFQWAFDRRRLVPGTSHVSLVASAAGMLTGRDNDAVAALAWQELSRAMPALAACRPRRRQVIRERRATFSVGADVPMRPASQTAIPGVILAGDWVDTGLPATIESAVLSGHRAARHVLDWLNTAARY
jgi:zeta-carotene desaturase